MIIHEAPRELVMNALRSIVPHISSWVICHGAEEKGTSDWIVSFFEGEGIPGLLLQNEWRDFGHNRDLCLKSAAENSLRRVEGREARVDYYLLMTPFQWVVLTQPGRSLKSLALTADAYAVVERDEVNTWTKTALVSSRLHWRWSGVVHEFLQRETVRGSGEWTAATDLDQDLVLQDLYFQFDSRADGSYTKLVLDLLLREVDQNPWDPRSRFYLANAYMDSKQFELAIEHYIHRIRLGGWVDEVYVSAYKTAQILHILYSQKSSLSEQVKDHIRMWPQLIYGDDFDVWHVLQAYTAAHMVLPYHH
eukprot:gene23876-9448_t